MLFIRAALLTLPRFVVILAIAITFQRLDVSPWPEWTGTMGAYLVLFATTLGFAWWVFRGRVPTITQIVLVACLFIVLQIIWEVALYVFITDAGWQEVRRGLSLSSVYVNALYALAVLGSGLWARRINHNRQTPEGLTV